MHFVTYAAAIDGSGEFITYSYLNNELFCEREILHRHPETD